MKARRETIGHYGEAIAQKHLRTAGYIICDTNWHCRAGEIDIVARQGDQWVFVEVKTRRGALTAEGFAGITPRKADRLVAAIYAYLDAHDLRDDARWRVDAIAVALPPGRAPIVEHVEDALDW